MRPSLIAVFITVALSGSISEALQSLSTPAAFSPEATLHSVGAYVEADSYNVPRPVKVIMWSKFLMRNPEWMRSHAPNCTLQRAFERTIGVGNVTVDPDYDISDADVVLFNVASLEQLYILPRKKMPGQLWIAGCWEPPQFHGVDIIGDCSLLSDQNTMQWMDGVASYDNSSTFPAFFTPPTEQQMRRPAPDATWQPGPLAEYSSSDCRVATRNDWVGAVNSSLVARNAEGVLSFGKCLQTAEEQTCSGPEAVSEPTDDAVEEWTFIKYANRCMTRPFTLVAENSMAPWYVTEKIWNALATGSVPVYLGPPEVKRLVPPGSIIYAGDYNSTDDLVDAMLRFDLAAHNRAREFKQQPVQSWGMWSQARKFSRATLMARLCEAVVARDALQDVGLQPSPPASLPSSATKQSAQLTVADPTAPLATEDVRTQTISQPQANTTSIRLARKTEDNAQTRSGSSSSATTVVASAAAVEEGGLAQDHASRASGVDLRLGGDDFSKVSAGGAAAEEVWQQVLVGTHGRANATSGSIHSEDAEAPGRVHKSASRATANKTERKSDGSMVKDMKRADTIAGLLKHNNSRHITSPAVRPDHTHHNVNKVIADKMVEESDWKNAEDTSITDKIEGFLKHTAAQDKKTRALLRRIADIKERESRKTTKK